MSGITIELTNEEQLKYDLTYKSIISNYTKKELESLQNDPIAMFYLKNIILKYVFTGELPSGTDIQNNIHLIDSENLNEYYDAKIPLQEKPEEVIIE